MNELVSPHDADTEHETLTVESVESGLETSAQKKKYIVNVTGGYGLFIESEKEIRPEDRIRLWKSIGGPIRGIFIFHTDGTTSDLFYRTEEEDQEYNNRRNQEAQVEKAKEWLSSGKAKFEADLAAAKLPGVFQMRMDAFMGRSRTWAMEFGPYELFVLTEAAKLAALLETPEKIVQFGLLPWEEQKKAWPEMSEEHSGNTFGSMVAFAIHLHKSPEIVPKMHGSLCPLVGCEAYGCWATTDEAKALNRVPKSSLPENQP